MKGTCNRSAPMRARSVESVRCETYFPIHSKRELPYKFKACFAHTSAGREIFWRVDDPKPFGVLDFLFKDGLEQTGIKPASLPIWKSGEIPEIAIIRREFDIDIEFADGYLACGKPAICNWLTIHSRNIRAMPFIYTVSDFCGSDAIDLGELTPVEGRTSCKSG